MGSVGNKRSRVQGWDAGKGCFTYKEKKENNMHDKQVAVGGACGFIVVSNGPRAWILVDCEAAVGPGSKVVRTYVRIALSSNTII